MGTRQSLIFFLFAIAVGAALPAAGQQPSAPNGNDARADSARSEQLLKSARNWRNKNDPDRERADLTELLRAEPNNPQALLMFGLLEIRTEHADAAASLLKRLKAAHSNSAAVVQLEEALRIAGSDSRRMAQVRLLFRAGRNDEAAAGMRALFPKGPSGGDLTLEYYRVIGATAKGWDEAKNGLEKLVAGEPDNVRYQFALAQHLANRPETRRAGVLALASLVKNPDVDKPQVMDAWRFALVSLDRSPEQIPLYLDYLALDPENVSVRNALEAARRFEAEQRPWALREQADALVAQGRLDEALSALKTALQLDPKNPWVRFDLSRLYHKRGAQKQGRALMEEGLAVSPNDPDMTYAVALYISLLDEADYAMRLLDKIPAAAQTPTMKGLREKMSILSQTQHAQALAKSGRRDDALAAMERAGVEAGYDVELIDIVASAWFSLGDPSRGVALMRGLMARQSSPSVAARLRYAWLLYRADQDKELAALLDKLSAARGITGKESEEVRQIRGLMFAHIADSRRNAGDYSGARAALAPALEREPDNADMLMALARVYIAMREPGKAQEVYRKILARAPKDVDARLALARLLNDAGDRTAAHREAEATLASAPADDIDTNMSVADIYIDMNDLVAAHKIIDRFKTSAPDNTRVLVESGRLAKAEGSPGEAAGYFRRAGADDEVARLDRDRKGAVVAAGVDNLFKAGVSGISKLSAFEAPVEVRVPAGYVGQAFFHVDAVNVSAGKLVDMNTDSYDLTRYGKIQANLAAITAGTLQISSATQSAQGTALAVGYESGNLRADIGTTPLGFPVSYVVGGLKMSDATGPYSYSLDIARRPVTSSLLSYAGARDPVDGTVWGGVRSNGATAHIGYDRGRFDAFADLGYYLLTGENVMTNRELALRTGLDWEFILEGDMRFSAGLVFTKWHYAEDLRYYSFGQGGYYSPQRYYSLSLPVRWTGRSGRWSYLVRASVAASVSYEKDMPYYPTDTGLQQAQTPGSADYLGGGGHGSGYSVGGALEYQTAPHMFVGGRFGIDRTAYYTPNFAVLYFRYMFDAQTGPVPFPPDPVKPYSRF